MKKIILFILFFLILAGSAQASSTYALDAHGRFIAQIGRVNYYASDIHKLEANFSAPFWQQLKALGYSVNINNINFKQISARDYLQRLLDLEKMRQAMDANPADYPIYAATKKLNQSISLTPAESPKIAVYQLTPAESPKAPVYYTQKAPTVDIPRHENVGSSDDPKVVLAQGTSVMIREAAPIQSYAINSKDCGPITAYSNQVTPDVY